MLVAKMKAATKIWKGTLDPSFQIIAAILISRPNWPRSAALPIVLILEKQLKTINTKEVCISIVELI